MPAELKKLMRSKTQPKRRLTYRMLVIVPPVLFLLFVGHSVITIRELLTDSTDLHLNYANGLVQEYFEGEVALQQQRLLACQQTLPCPGTEWLSQQANGPALTRALADDAQPIYLNVAAVHEAVSGFVDSKKGLKGLIEARYHEPVYWFRIFNRQGETIYQSGPELRSAKGIKTYPMETALPGYALEIAYNSFGAKQLYSVASKRINFGLIFLLFVLAILSLVLFTRAIRQKIQLAKQKTFFVSTVSHEFKTPLAIMKLAEETLSTKRYSSEEEANRFLRMIGNEINHLNHLVHKILSFSKIEMGQIQFHLQPLDLIELLNISKQNYEIRAEAEGVTLRWTMPDQSCWINGDPDLIRHAVDNVLDNAFKYRGDSELIEVTCTVDDHEAVLSISDEGVGIAADELPHIFKSFYRVSSSATEGIRGSGLGLAVSRYILNRCQAKLHVHSELGAGSTFNITFPILRNSPERGIHG